MAPMRHEGMVRLFVEQIRVGACPSQRRALARDKFIHGLSAGGVGRLHLEWEASLVGDPPYRTRASITLSPIAA
jgi:hypothetical protein